jgi:hypothetical protein
MTQPIKSSHALLLNRLAEMQRAMYYASARQELRLAEETILAQENRIAELEAGRYVPGVWHCTSCDFTWVRSILNATTGQVGANDEEEFLQCPNDKERMERTTWKEWAESLTRVGESQVRRAVLAEEDNLRLRLALEKAQNGLEWYRSEHPEDESPADDEMRAEIHAALSGTPGAQRFVRREVLDAVVALMRMKKAAAQMLRDDSWDEADELTLRDAEAELENTRNAELEESATPVPAVERCPTCGAKVDSIFDHLDGCPEENQ